MLQDYDTSFSRVYFSRPRLFSSPSLLSRSELFFPSVVARSFSLYRLSFDLLPGAGSGSLQRLLRSVIGAFKRRNRGKSASFEEKESAVSSRQCTVSQINEIDNKIA
ncbi:hypothetical protein TNCV_4515791 [Trichonephila clavipes]|nr:hypothetical protein TNCV_4515791 [Trichonephila clavipes]